MKIKVIHIILFYTSLSLVMFTSCSKTEAPVYMANGIKIGEVTQNSAIIWTRLTKHPERNINGHNFPKSETKHVNPPFGKLEEMKAATPGTTGEVHILYNPMNRNAEQKSTPWRSVHAKSDFTLQFQLTDLLPGVEYVVIVEGRSDGANEVSCRVVGKFISAPSKEDTAKVSFSVVTGQEYHRRDDLENGHKIYPLMQNLNPSFFVHTGDIEYFDKPLPYALNVELARFKWNRIYSMPFQREFHNNVASYFIKDDHETLKDDCWPGQTYGDLTFDDGLKIFKEQVPMGEKTYRTIRWGKDLQIWLVEGRDYRSDNDMPDGANKTIWGSEQKKWFVDTVEKSDATFRILISPTPIVGPDRVKKNDNHSNKGFTYEGNEIRSFIGKQKNMFVICGDRHWQYVSIDTKTGVKEYSCGPTTDLHAGGFNENMRTEMHKYLKIRGGFLSVIVERQNGKPEITFRHYGTDGGIYNEDKIKY